MDAKDKPKLTAGEAYAGPGVPKNDVLEKGTGYKGRKWRDPEGKMEKYLGFV